MGTVSNTSGIGARIEVAGDSTSGQAAQIREVQTHSGWRSQSDLVQHFGLGSSTSVDVVVRWPSGTEDHLTDIAANQEVVIVEGS